MVDDITRDGPDISLLISVSDRISVFSIQNSVSGLAEYMVYGHLLSGFLLDIKFSVISRMS